MELYFFYLGLLEFSVKFKRNKNVNMMKIPLHKSNMLFFDKTSLKNFFQNPQKKTITVRFFPITIYDMDISFYPMNKLRASEKFLS